MTARPMLLILAGSLISAPLALAGDHAVARGSGTATPSGLSATPSFTSNTGSHFSSPARSSPTVRSPRITDPSVASLPLALMQDRAVPRGGGGKSSSSGSGVSSRSSRGGSSSSTGSTSSSSATRSTAERRHPRAGTGRANDVRRGSYPRYTYDYYYYYPRGGWGSYWWPYGSYGWYGGYWGYPWGVSRTYHYVQRETAAIRVLVDPSEARVYVDGYYAGAVDDFDGLFQRLHVSPGRHEIALKLEGYKTHRMKVYASPSRTLKLRYRMQRGSGESFEDLAGPLAESNPPRDLDREQAGIESQEPDDLAGELRLEVRPSDASVYVDGAFRGTAREAATLPLPPGPHRIEIVRPGYRTVEREVEIITGETVEVAIELDRSAI